MFVTVCLYGWMVQATKLKKSQRSIFWLDCLFFAVKTKQTKTFSQASDKLNIKDKIIESQRNLSPKSKIGSYDFRTFYLCLY